MACQQCKCEDDERSPMEKFKVRTAQVIAWVGDRLDTSSDTLAAHAFYGGMNEDSYVNVVQRRGSSSGTDRVVTKSLPEERSMDNLDRRKASIGRRVSVGSSMDSEKPHYHKKGGSYTSRH